ncbi:hypothetical protein [Gemmatimonas sp.]|jgi:hypothetical protein|uniref:hypothetical protein n=1 Tax=Gemmatimonas sp. TaxID=1962908 RepID=UPI0022C491DD|nr:hypothetical protein [Gemmatimonas sp.]MCZ8013903.1 hypothetical protein [Gemmatimonas sp.]MCZ8266474.1 hypothetical protein [Gemmatimonas sp.]
MSHRIGTWANKHRVRGNSNQSPDYAYWNHFRIVATVAPERRTAVFSAWLDNRMVLIGERRPDAGQFRVDHAADGFERDTLALSHVAAHAGAGRRSAGDRRGRAPHPQGGPRPDVGLPAVHRRHGPRPRRQ